jgi:hypothetical protein
MALKCLDVMLKTSLKMVINTRDESEVLMYRAVPIVSFAHRLSKMNAEHRSKLANMIHDSSGVVGAYVRRKTDECTDVELVCERALEDFLKEVARSMSALCVAVCGSNPSHEIVLMELSSAIGIRDVPRGPTVSSILVARSDDEFDILASSFCTYCVVSTSPSDVDVLSDVADMLYNTTSHWSITDLLLHTDTGVLVTPSCERCCRAVKQCVERMLVMFLDSTTTLLDVALRSMVTDHTFYQLWSAMKMQFNSSSILLRWMERGSPTMATATILLCAFSDDPGLAPLSDRIESVAVDALCRARIVAVASATRLLGCALLFNTTWELIEREEDAVMPEHVQAIWNASAYLPADAALSTYTLESMSVYLLSHTSHHTHPDIDVQCTRAVRALLMNSSKLDGMSSSNKRISDALEDAFARRMGTACGVCCSVHGLRMQWSRVRRAIARILQLTPSHGASALSLSVLHHYEFCRELIVTDNATNATIEFEESARRHLASNTSSPESQTLRIRSIFTVERACVNVREVCIRILSRG